MISFLEKLIQRVRLDPNLSPNEVHVFNVHAAYGHYQIMIGPMEKVKKATENQTRPIEINGVMHHLFVANNRIAPHPTHRQIHNNLKGCIIMRDLTIHLKDATGTGRRVEGAHRDQAVAAREEINLAGPEGEKQLQRMIATGKLAKETYKIVQEDILNALVNKQFTRE